MKKRLLLFIVAGLLLSTLSNAQQKHIVVLGSSTAAGTGPSTLDSAWVWRLQGYYRKNTTPGNPDTVVTNLALGGFTTYHVMPAPSATYVTPNGKPLPDQSRNVTMALSLNPDIIVINLPSNDTDWGFSKKETMDNFRLLFTEIINAGKKVYITTTQPRNFADFARRDSLRTLVDSINNNFGMYAIDFWSDLVSNDGQYNISSAVNVDGIHVNDLGHRLLFQKAVEKEFFPSNAPLPLQLKNFKAALNNNKATLWWESFDEEPQTRFIIQRSSEGTIFQSVGEVNGKGQDNNFYSWTDDHTPAGKIFYRLKISENNRSFYSDVVVIQNKGKELAINQAIISGEQLSLKISSMGNKNAQLRIFHISGGMVYQGSYQLKSAEELLTISLAVIATGEYIVQVSTTDGNVDATRFVKLR